MKTVHGMVYQCDFEEYYDDFCKLVRYITLPMFMPAPAAAGRAILEEIKRGIK